MSPEGAGATGGLILPKKDDRPGGNGRRLVEMAGIEPASGRFGPRTSTSVVGRGSRPGPYDRQKGIPAQPLVLRTGRGPPVRHPDFVAPGPPRSGGGVGGRGLASQETSCPIRAASGSNGEGSNIRAVGTYLFAPVLRGDAPRLAVRDLSPSVEAFHPHDVKVPWTLLLYHGDRKKSVRIRHADLTLTSQSPEPAGPPRIPKGSAAPKSGTDPIGLEVFPRGPSPTQGAAGLFGPVRHRA